MRLLSNNNLLLGTQTDNGNRLQVNGTSYLGKGLITTNDFNATGGQYANYISNEQGGTSWAINLATLIPNFRFSGRALSITMQIIGVRDSSNGVSFFSVAYRSIGGTWVISNIAGAQNGSTGVSSITASGTTITVNFNTFAFGSVNFSIINRG
jgi:hypothetical protein